MFTLDANVQDNLFTKHFIEILDANAKQTYSTNTNKHGFS